MPRELRPCGTRAAHARHVRHGDEPCDPCRDAYLEEQAGLRQARRDDPKAARARKRVPRTPTVKPAPYRRVVFPTLDADTFAGAPCHTEDENLWEPARDGESDRAARVRWREAAELCELCPAFDACARLADAQLRLDGVWAGRVPRIRGERR